MPGIFNMPQRLRALTAAIDAPLPPKVAIPVELAAPTDDNENSIFAARGRGGSEIRQIAVPGSTPNTAIA